MREDLPRLAVEVGLRDVAARGEDAAGVAAGVPLPRQDVIFAPVLRHAAVLEVRRRLRVVAADDVERLAVGREPHRVRAVLAAALERLQLLDLVEHVVVLRRRDAIQPAAGAAVAHDVQRRPCATAAPARAVIFAGILLDLRLLVGADLARRDADSPLPPWSLAMSRPLSSAVMQTHEPSVASSAR